MRKQQYIATVACLVAGVIGFVSVYATDKGKERREAEQEIAAQTQQEAPASYEVKPEISVEDATKKAEEQALKLAAAESGIRMFGLCNARSSQMEFAPAREMARSARANMSVSSALAYSNCA